MCRMIVGCLCWLRCTPSMMVCPEVNHPFALVPFHCADRFMLFLLGLVCFFVFAR